MLTSRKEAKAKNLAFAGTGIRPGKRVAVWQYAMRAARGEMTADQAGARAAKDTGIDIAMIMQIIQAIMEFLKLFNKD